ncbi:phage major tail protein, TP901-1 family [Olsenella phocaeensis]|uniref:phage major tail protein, TP901-1 family n=1 Tax=Olsenella phocaeensis TaxID=1852385 RepID=UPI0009311314|nr:phage major tail protein, TP901-1 family [Olsenella phocaeensis]
MPETTTNFDSGAYCATTGGVSAVKGADVLTCIFSADGAKLLAIEGEKSSKLSLSADTTSFSSKDSKGSWKKNSPSTKSWEMTLDTVMVKDAESNKAIRQAFEDGTALCVKQVYDDGQFTPRGGGMAVVTKYEDDSPSDDLISISVSLTGSGKWTWFDIDTAAAAKATAKPSNRTA